MLQPRESLDFSFGRIGVAPDRNTSLVPLEARPELFEKGLYLRVTGRRMPANAIERQGNTGDSDGEILR